MRVRVHVGTCALLCTAKLWIAIRIKSHKGMICGRTQRPLDGSLASSSTPPSCKTRSLCQAVLCVPCMAASDCSLNGGHVHVLRAIHNRRPLPGPTWAELLVQVVGGTDAMDHKNQPVKLPKMLKFHAPILVLLATDQMASRSNKNTISLPRKGRP